MICMMNCMMKDLNDMLLFYDLDLFDGVFDMLLCVLCCGCVWCVVVWMFVMVVLFVVLVVGFVVGVVMIECGM